MKPSLFTFASLVCLVRPLRFVCSFKTLVCDGILHQQEVWYGVSLDLRGSKLPNQKVPQFLKPARGALVPFEVRLRGDCRSSFSTGKVLDTSDPRDIIKPSLATAAFLFDVAHQPEGCLESARVAYSSFF